MKDSQKLAIFGSSGHAFDIQSTFLKMYPNGKVAFIKSDQENYYVEKYSNSGYGFIIGIGDNRKRKSIAEKYKNYAILHCGSAYPLKYEDVNLKYIQGLKKIFPQNLIGYSDHTIGISTCMAAVSLGVRIIEKHFTISKNDGAPDSFFFS